MEKDVAVSEVFCEKWFFSLAAVLLLLRSMSDVLGVAAFPVPAQWESLSIAFLSLFHLFFRPSRQLTLAFVLWFLTNLFLSWLMPVPQVFRWLLLMFFVEAGSRPQVPAAWCLLWLALPAFHSSLFGEPLCPSLLACFTAICLFVAYRTTVPKWFFPSRRNFLSELFTGLAIGTMVVLFPPSGSMLAWNELPTVVLDEAHGTSESGVGTTDVMNGHQQLVRFLEKQGVKVVLEKNGLDSLPPKSLFITILPTRPFQETELTSIKKHIEDGGGALVILDHTDMDGASSRLAPFFAQCGVQPGFDTIAWPGNEPPLVGFSSLLGGVAGYPGTGATIQAPSFWWPHSLANWGPHPLVWISGGYSSAMGTPSGTVNQQMSPLDSRLMTRGLTWVGAWGPLGKGRWAVLSDSSWFQNGQLAQNTRFLQGLFSLLVVPAESRGFMICLTMILVILATFSLGYRKLGKPILVLGLIMGLALGKASLGISRSKVIDPNQPLACVLLDPAAAARVTAVQESTFLSNVDTFLDQLFQAGWQIQLVNIDQNASGRADAWIIPPSDAPLKSVWWNHIERQVKEGAHVLIFANHLVPRSGDVLNYFGFESDRRPKTWFEYEHNTLGLVERANVGPVELFPTGSPWLGSWTQPLWSDNPVPIYGGEPLFKRADKTPVIARKALGKGSVIAIGDVSFFSNGALEIRGILNDPVKKEFIQNFATYLRNREKP